MLGGPRAQRGDATLGECAGELVGQVVLRGQLRETRRARELGRLAHVVLRGPDHGVWIAESERAADLGTRPWQPQDLRAGRDHLVGVTIEHGLDQQVPRFDDEAPRVTDLRELAADDEERVGLVMAMTR